MAIVGVMGSGKVEWEALSTPLGEWIAEQGFDLLTGAGLGVMLSTARAFSTTHGRKGRSIGIMPSEAHPVRGFVPLQGYPNPYIDLPILTPLPRKLADAPDDALNRNYVNVLTSDVVVALPGNQGTLDEIRLATRFTKPLICIGPPDAFEGVPPGTRIVSALEDVYQFVLATIGSVDETAPRPS
ncbi:DNA-binding protein [Paraburkholderia pallida]|uniref:DNA-binding protein n=1 Tax=Paraburkholderia pallida TaxID=2547399 RepID=A0A4P7D8U1_9BURK|nr:DNA-binding protein [Paraburkholderia pallida]QBR03445.1 DNA-binding protein [Paraburkholderia pallida]